MFRRLLPAAIVMVIAALPARADEFTDVVEGALTAYRDGDITIAKEELDYALRLLNDMKAASLANYLPEALAGWTRQVEEAENAGFAMSMFGGGTTAAATYVGGGEQFTITLVANSPMVAGMGAMISGLGAVSGRPMRIQRVQFANNEGELQGVVENRVLITVDGSATVEDKVAHLEAMDFRALGSF